MSRLVVGDVVVCRSYNRAEREYTGFEFHAEILEIDLERPYNRICNVQRPYKVKGVPGGPSYRTGSFMWLQRCEIKGKVK